MLGIDYDKLEDMVFRMEQVAASMEESSKRVLEAAKLMAVSPATVIPAVHTHVILDGKKIADAIVHQQGGGEARRCA